MGKRELLCVVVCALWASVAAADPPECPQGRPPLDAGHAPLAVQRLATKLGRRLRRPVSPGTTVTVARYCVSRAGVFYNPQWLGAANGPAPQAEALAQLAWLAGLQRAHYPSRAPNMEAAAADLTGCALAWVGLKGDALSLQLLALDAATAPHALGQDWAAAINRGYARCRP